MKPGLLCGRAALCVWALLVCVPCGAQTARSYALRGTLVMPDGLVEGGTVLVRDGVIAASGAQVEVPVGILVVETHGVIAPGLIDLHNHLTWNVFPRWHPLEEFGSRYDWQQKAVYEDTVSGPHASLVADGLECAMERYAEVKALTEGETSVVGSLQEACSAGLARNLDMETKPTALVDYDVFPLQMTEERLASVKQRLKDKTTSALLIHLAEGAPNDASATREFQQLKGRGLLVPGVVLIHGVGLKAADFAQMAEHHVGMVWSPRSNVELYGDTARVLETKRAGVRLALAPDWSITGSDGMLGELNYASRWSQIHGQPFTDRELVGMATGEAAELAGEGGQLGSLAAGHRADLLVVIPGVALPESAGASRHDAWWTLTHAGPAQVALVTVNGEPLYGDGAMLAQLRKGAVEAVTICGVTRGLMLGGGSAGAEASWAATSSTLVQAMAEYGRRLAPLSECGD